MRKWILLLIVAAFVMGTWPRSAEAGRRHHKKQAVEVNEDDHNVGGVKIDAPNLIKIDKEGKWTLGAEGGKDIIRDIFYDADERFFESDKGYFAYVKVTYNGCLLNCKDKTEE